MHLGSSMTGAADEDHWDGFGSEIIFSILIAPTPSSALPLQLLNSRAIWVCSSFFAATSLSSLRNSVKATHFLEVCAYNGCFYSIMWYLPLWIRLGLVTSFLD